MYIIIYNRNKLCIFEDTKQLKTIIMNDLIAQYEKIMNTLTPLLVADRLKEIKAEFDNKFKN